jgi:hypothetical protein
MKINRLLFLTVWVIAPLFTLASHPVDAVIVRLERNIALLHDSLAQSKYDEQTLRYAQQMMDSLAIIPANAETFNHPFNLWKFCRLISADGRLRIINWNAPLQNGEHVYFGIVWIWNEEEKTYYSVVLKDNMRDLDKFETRYLDAETWPAALYYEIIPHPKGRGSKRCDTYTLLGWDGRDNLTNAKVLDVIKITAKDKIRFGEGLFETGTGMKKRLMFQYADEVSASFKYYPKKKCIVMDHLSPKSSMMEGVFADYGPDGTYDLYQWEKGKWKLYSNIDISLFSSSDTKMYKPPVRQRNF